MKPGPQRWRYKVIDGVEKVLCSRCKRWQPLDMFVQPTPSAAKRGEPVGNGHCKRCLRVMANARTGANSELRERYREEWDALIAKHVELAEKREQERDPI